MENWARSGRQWGKQTDAKEIMEIELKFLFKYRKKAQTHNC